MYTFHYPGLLRVHKMLNYPTVEPNVHFPLPGTPSRKQYVKLPDKRTQFTLSISRDFFENMLNLNYPIVELNVHVPLPGLPRVHNIC